MAAGRARFAGRGYKGEGDGQSCLGQPGKQPLIGGRVAARDERGRQSRQADARYTPSRNGGKGPGALHRFPDKTEVIRGASFERDQDGTARSRWSGGRHANEHSLRGAVVKRSSRAKLSVPEPDRRKNAQRDEEQQNYELGQLKRHLGLGGSERVQRRNLQE